MLILIYQVSLALLALSLVTLLGCVVVRTWPQTEQWPRMTWVSLLGLITALGLQFVIGRRVDRTVEVEPLERWTASLTGLPMLALLLISLGGLVIWWYRQQSRMILFTVVDGRVLDEGARSAVQSRGSAPGQASTGVRVLALLDGGPLRPGRYTEVAVRRFWAEPAASDGGARLGTADLSAPEQQLICDELIRRNAHAWRQRSRQVRELLGEGD